MLSVAFLAQHFAAAYFLQETKTKNLTVQLQMKIKMAAFLRKARLFSSSRFQGIAIFQMLSVCSE